MVNTDNAIKAGIAALAFDDFKKDAQTEGLKVVSLGSSKQLWAYKGFGGSPVTFGTRAMYESEKRVSAKIAQQLFTEAFLADVKETQ